MDWLLLLLVAGAFVVLTVAGVAAVILIVLSGRPGPRSYGPAHRPTFSTPLERAQATASELTPEEWVEFRRWVKGGRSHRLTARASPVKAAQPPHR